jgi:hypothetical protein
MQRRFDQQEADRKMEVQKQEAQAKYDKLHAQLEKGESRDGQTRCAARVKIRDG